ncbi:HAD-like domain-containing protein [Haematococcus lacustris]
MQALTWNDDLQCWVQLSPGLPSMGQAYLLPPQSHSAQWGDERQVGEAQEQAQEGTQPVERALRKTLVLDLDRTLVDCILLQDPASSPPDFVYTDVLGVQAKVWTRPGLAHFLAEVARMFEVVLFTAAGARHADCVLQHIDPQGVLFSHRLYAQHTVEQPSWGWVKDLSRLGRDLAHTLIVDDSALAALLQPCNLVPIRPFDQADPDKAQDTALAELLTFLTTKVLPAQDVRCAIASHWHKVKRCARKRPLRTRPAAPPSGPDPTPCLAMLACHSPAPTCTSDDFPAPLSQFRMVSERRGWGNGSRLVPVRKGAAAAGVRRAA